MKEYLKRKLSKIKIKIDTYPQYYEDHGEIIKLCENGEKFVVKFDKNSNEKIIKKCNK